MKISMEDRIKALEHARISPNPKRWEGKDSSIIMRIIRRYAERKRTLQFRKSRKAKEYLS